MRSVGCLLLLIYCIAGSIRQEKLSPHYIDFPGAYYGAVVAWCGRWDILYPIPHTNADRNAGVASDIKPEAMDFCAMHEVPPTHFIYPPACALFLSPMGTLSFEQAKVAWQILGGLSVWGIAIISALLARPVWGKRCPGWVGPAVACLIVFAPRSILELSHGNMSHVVGLLMAAAVMFLINRRPAAATVMIILAAGMKVTPVILLVPCLPWLIRRPIACGLIVLGCCLVPCVTGLRVWLEFFSNIAPTLTRTWLPEYPGDHSTASIHGIVGLLLPGQHLTLLASILIKLVSVLVLALVFIAYFPVWRLKEPEPRIIIGFGLGLVAWSLLFSPILWHHYWYYYLFSTPLLLDAVYRRRWSSIAAVGVLWFMFGPWGRIPPFHRFGYPAQMVPGWICMLLIAFSLWERFTMPPCSDQPEQAA